MGVRKFTDDQEKMACERYLAGENTYQLAAQMGVTPATINRMLKRHDVEVRSISEAKGGLPAQKEAEVCSRYIEGENTVQLAAAMAVSPPTIKAILQRHGVEVRSISEARKKFDAEQEKLICDRYAAGENTYQLAIAMGVSAGTIGNILNRNNIDTKSGLSEQQEAEVCSRYFTGENTVQLGAEMGVHNSTISAILKRHDVKVRSISEAKGGLSAQKEAEVCSRYILGKNTVQLGAEMGVTPSTIRAILKRHGVEMRSISEAKGGLTAQQEAEVCSRYITGESTVLLAAVMGVSASTISAILARNCIERRLGECFGDGMQNALDGTGYHSHIRDCSFYLYSLARYSDTHCKPGVAFNVEARAAQSYGEYGKEHLRVTFATRQEAFLLEQALLNATCGAATCPDDLRDWQGATEVREIPAEDMLPIAERLIDELDELGVWDFACLRVPMTMEQRAICQQRALSGAPVIAVTPSAPLEAFSAARNPEGAPQHPDALP